MVHRLRKFAEQIFKQSIFYYALQITLYSKHSEND